MFGSNREKHTKTHSKSRRSARSRSTQVSRGTCEMLRGGLQDFPSPSTSRRASLPKKRTTSKKQGNSIKKLHNWMVRTCLCNTTGTKTVQSLNCTCGTSAVPCACQIVGRLSLHHDRDVEHSIREGTDEPVNVLHLWNLDSPRHLLNHGHLPLQPTKKPAVAAIAASSVVF